MGFPRGTMGPRLTPPYPGWAWPCASLRTTCVLHTSEISGGLYGRTTAFLATAGLSGPSSTLSFLVEKQEKEAKCRQ